MYVLGQKAAALGVDGCDSDGVLHHIPSLDDEDEETQQDLGQDIVPIDEYSHASSDEFKTKKHANEKGSNSLTSSFSNSELKDVVHLDSLISN